MGQYSCKSPYDNWKPLNELTKSGSDPEKFQALLADINKKREEAEDVHVKADLALCSLCFQMYNLRVVHNNPARAMQIAEDDVDLPENLKQASAKWESWLLGEIADNLLALGEARKALESYQNAASVVTRWFGYTQRGPSVWNKASRVARIELNQPVLAAELAQRAIDYAYRWASDLYASPEEWKTNVSRFLDNLIAALEASGQTEQALAAKKQKEELQFPQAAIKTQSDEEQSTEIPPHYQVQDIVMKVPGASRQQLQEWLAYIEDRIANSPKSNFHSLWVGAKCLIKAGLEPDLATAAMISRDAQNIFMDYKASSLALVATKQGAAILHRANLPAKEQEYLDAAQQVCTELYGADDRITMIEEAHSINGPIKRRDHAQYIADSRKLLKRAQALYPQDQDLLTQLQALSPPEAQTDILDGEISPEKQALLDQALKQLESMVGIEQAKSQVEDLSDFIFVQRQRQAAGEKVGRRANHFVFTGPPGTGKTTVARLLGQILYALDQLPSQQLLEVTPSELIAGYTGQTAIKTREVIERAKGGVLFIDEAYQLGGAAVGTEVKGYGGEAMAELILAMENERDNLTVVFAGYGPEMSRFMDTNPGLASRVTETINFPAYSSQQLAEIFKSIVAAAGYQLDPSTEKPLPSVIEQIQNMEGGKFGNGRAMRNLFEDSIVRQAKRLGRIKLPDDQKEQLSLLIAQDLEPDLQESRDLVLDQALKELDGLIGIKAAKQQVRELKDLVAVRRQRESVDLDNQSIGNHLVFTGPPGTGKTTVARIVAKILYALEQIPTPNLVEATRADLVAGYVGQTAIKTRQLLDRARGGVLFIDEAYSLAPNESDGGFDEEAIAELVKVMEDERQSLVVILAGYSRDMERLLDANQGMRSRVAKIINFPAYSSQELFEIFEGMLHEAQYVLGTDARQKAQELCQQIANQPTSKGGNTRDVRRMMESSLLAQASRLEGKDASRAELSEIQSADLRWESSGKKEKAIGFSP